MLNYTIVDWQEISTKENKTRVVGRLHNYTNVYVMTSPLTKVDDKYIYGVLGDRYQLGEEKK